MAGVMTSVMACLRLDAWFKNSKPPSFSNNCIITAFIRVLSLIFCWFLLAAKNAFYFVNIDSEHYFSGVETS